MDEPTPKSLFTESLHRCTANDQFIPSFYEQFLASSDDVRRRFRFTSFEKQNKLLVRSLELAAQATEGEPKALAELKERGKTHDRNHLDIKPDLYALWLDSLVATAREFDSQWDDSIESAWRTILGFVVRRMISAY